MALTLTFLTSYVYTFLVLIGLLTSLALFTFLLFSSQAPSFYWEVEVVSYGDIDDDTGPIVSFGFATEAEKRDGAWTNPVGTCLFHK